LTADWKAGKTVAARSKLYLQNKKDQQCSLSPKLMAQGTRFTAVSLHSKAKDPRVWCVLSDVSNIKCILKEFPPWFADPHVNHIWKYPQDTPRSVLYQFNMCHSIQPSWGPRLTITETEKERKRGGLQKTSNIIQEHIYYQLNLAFEN
jgi:hypothetical protein